MPMNGESGYEPWQNLNILNNTRLGIDSHTVLSVGPLTWKIEEGILESSEVVRDASSEFLTSFKNAAYSWKKKGIAKEGRWLREINTERGRGFLLNVLYFHIVASAK